MDHDQPQLCYRASRGMSPIHLSIVSIPLQESPSWFHHRVTYTRLTRTDTNIEELNVKLDLIFPLVTPQITI